MSRKLVQNKKRNIYSFVNVTSIKGMTPSKQMSVYFFITSIKTIISNKMKERECKTFMTKVFVFILINLLSKRIEVTLI